MSLIRDIIKRGNKIVPKSDALLSSIKKDILKICKHHIILGFWYLLILAIVVELQIWGVYIIKEMGYIKELFYVSSYSSPTKLNNYFNVYQFCCKIWNKMVTISNFSSIIFDQYF